MYVLIPIIQYILYSFFFKLRLEAVAGASVQQLVAVGDHDCNEDGDTGVK